MFRFTLLSLFLVAANADFLSEVDLKRQLQDFDLDAFSFNFAGINIDAEIAQNACPEAWQATISCVISDCPQFMDVCPELEVPEENMGTSPPAPVVEDADMDMEMEMEMEDGNHTAMDMNMTEEMPVQLPAEPEDVAAAAAEEVPTCDELETEFCDAFVTEEYEDCCLIDCVEHLQALVVCLVKEISGEDRSDCTIPTCPEPVPGGTTTAADTPAPAPDSGATGVISRFATLAASAIAFYML